MKIHQFGIYSRDNNPDILNMARAYVHTRESSEGFSRETCLEMMFAAQAVSDMTGHAVGFVLNETIVLDPENPRMSLEYLFRVQAP